MSGVSRELQMTLQAAYREAVHRRHAYVTVEHLLFALLHDERGAEIISQSGGHVEALKDELERFFRDDLETVPGEDPVEARQTLAFHRVLQHAVDHMESAEKEEVEIADLLIALYQEPDSHAVMLLRSQ
jgi:ATP-dependent Clp protease ATP-binding subunit ClpA